MRKSICILALAILLGVSLLSDVGAAWGYADYWGPNYPEYGMGTPNWYNPYYVWHFMTYDAHYNWRYISYFSTPYY
jgi:hypothetical protein